MSLYIDIDIDIYIYNIYQFKVHCRPLPIPRFRAPLPTPPGPVCQSAPTSRCRPAGGRCRWLKGRIFSGKKGQNPMKLMKMRD